MVEIPLDKLAKTLGATLDETARAFTIGLFNGVIRDTRVDTGRLRGNWQTTVGAPASSELDRKDKVDGFVDGGKAQDDVKKKVQSDTVMYLTNNLPYAGVYEQKDGMIAKNVARLDRTTREAIAKAKS